MKMYGKYFRDISGVSDVSSLHWISHSFVSKNTEGFIFTSQEQAVQIKFMKAKILGEGTNALCRVCKKDVETVGHLVAGVVFLLNVSISEDMIRWA